MLSQMVVEHLEQTRHEREMKQAVEEFPSHKNLLHSWSRNVRFWEHQNVPSSLLILKRHRFGNKSEGHDRILTLLCP